MKNKLTLTLILIQQWFTATFKGIKKEEYIAITPYWAKRLLCMENGDSLTKCYSEETIAFITIYLLDFKSFGLASVDEVLEIFHIRFKDIESTDFRNGYKSLNKVPRFIIENKGITIGKGNPDWGYVGDKNVFIIHHGEIIEQFNIDNIPALFLPSNEKELEEFNEKYKDFDFKLKDKHIDAKAIIEGKF